MYDIKKVLMERDGLSDNDAENLIQDAKNDMLERLAQGEIPDDICQEWFGLEPDYLFDLMDY